MKKILSLLTFIYVGVLFAQEPSIEELAKLNFEGTKLFEQKEKTFYNRVGVIIKDSTLSDAQKERKVYLLRQLFMSDSRKIHAQYRQPFLDKVLEETNSKLNNDNKLKASLGSSVYKTDSNGNILTDSNGNKILNPKHRGMKGDLDLAGTDKAIKELEKTFEKYGIKPSTSPVKVSTGEYKTANYTDFKNVEVTVNSNIKHIDTVNTVTDEKLAKNPNLKLTSEHQAQMYRASISPNGEVSHNKKIELDAYSKETYVSVGMSDNQAGRKLVETNDHIKKAAYGLKADPKELLNAKGEDLFQGMNKGTLKAISSANVTDGQIEEILVKNQMDISVDEFKHSLNSVKSGQIAQGVGIVNETKMAKYQQACFDITETAKNNTSKVAMQELSEIDARIEELSDLYNNTPEGAEKEAYKRQMKMWTEQQIDSRLRISKTEEANAHKLGQTIISSEGVEMSKLQKGLNIGQKTLNVASNLSDGYEIYDSYSKMKSGEITQNQATAKITEKVVDVGFGLAVDSAVTAATVTTTTSTLGAIATVGAPIIISSVAANYVGEATKEGLELLATYKNEEILNKIADAKMQETANAFMLKAEELLKEGIKTGDADKFMDADELSWRLYDLYQQTKDSALLDASVQIGERSGAVKDFLEQKHGVSIFKLKDKLAQNIEVQKPTTSDVLLDNEPVISQQNEDLQIEQQKIQETTETNDISSQPIQSDDGEIVFEDSSIQQTNEDDIVFVDESNELAYLNSLEQAKNRQEYYNAQEVDAQQSDYIERDQAAREELRAGLQSMAQGLMAVKSQYDAQNRALDATVKANQAQVKSMLQETNARYSAYQNNPNNPIRQAEQNALGQYNGSQTHTSNTKPTQNHQATNSQPTYSKQQQDILNKNAKKISESFYIVIRGTNTGNISGPTTQPTKPSTWVKKDNYQCSWGPFTKNELAKVMSGTTLFAQMPSPENDGYFREKSSCNFAP